jgi:hypothetical protein
MNDGSCMMLPDKGGEMIKFPHEPMTPFSFKKKDNELMEYYIDVGIRNYTILDMKQIGEMEKNQDIENQKNQFEGYWRMSFDVYFSHSGS